MIPLRKTILSRLFLTLFLFLSATGSPLWPTDQIEGVEGSPGHFRAGDLPFIGGDRESGGGIVPESIEADREGNLYVIDAQGASLMKYGPDGVSSWRIDGGEWGGGGFLMPREIGVSSGLLIYLLDIGRREIFQINNRGEIIGIVAEERVEDPRAIAMAGSGKLVIYDGSTSEVSILSPTGSLLWSFQPAGFHGRSRVRMALKGEEELCLYTRGSAILRIYYFMGGLKRAWEPVLPGGEKLLSISSVSFDEQGRAYVLDDRLPGLFLFDGLGNLLLDMRESLKDVGFEGPGDVRPSGSFLYLADTRKGSIFRFPIPSGEP